MVSLLRWPLHTLGCAYTLPPTPTLLCPQVDCPLVSFNNEWGLCPNSPQQCPGDCLNSPHDNLLPLPPTLWRWKYILCLSCPMPEQVGYLLSTVPMTAIRLISLLSFGLRGESEPRVFCGNVATWGHESRPNSDARSLQDDKSMTEKFGGALRIWLNARLVRAGRENHPGSEGQGACVGSLRRWGWSK